MYGNKLEDKVNFMEGKFQVYVIEDGKYINSNNVKMKNKSPFIKKDNLIVNGAKKLLPHFVGDCDSKNGCLNVFKLGGDDSLLGSQMLNPTSPQVTDTDLVYTTNEFVLKRGDISIGNESLFVVEYPNSPNESSVLFKLRIPKEKANHNNYKAKSYTAAGLFFDDGSTQTLFASVTFGVISKTEKRELLFEWELKF